MTNTYKYIDHTEKERILDLISETLSVENAQIVSDQWAWRYENHPFISKQYHPFFVCEENGIFVCAASILPSIFKVNNFCVPMVNCIDFMSHPAHRGTGIRLVKELIKRKKIIVGSPNPRSKQLWQRLAPRDINFIKVIQITYPINLKIINK